MVCLLALMAGCMPRVTPSSSRYAYVTNEKDNNLLVVDLNTEKVIKTLPTGRIPHALVFTPAGKGYVNNRGEHSLTVIDGNNLTVLKKIPLPATSMQIALSPDGKTLAVGYKDALLITLIDTATDRILGSVPIGRDKNSKKPIRIMHPFWSKDGRFVYAGDNLNKTVVKIDAARQKITATIPLKATVHHFITAPDGTIYICEVRDNRGRLGVAVLDGTTDRIIKRIKIPMPPGETARGHHGKFTPDGKFFYFCNEGGRTLAIIDTATLQLVKTIQVGKGAGHTYFSRDGKRAFIVCHHDNIVSVIDTASQRLIKNVSVGTGKKEGHSGYIGDDGSFYMLNAADGMICRINGRTLALQSRIKVGRNPMIMVVRILPRR
ncbi:MAG: hypothetical protein GXP59_03175 [Deltaproteobacteria bacterium]|nr:hypothetical protein [Deltaproteobacteria bacterium]